MPNTCGHCTRFPPFLACPGRLTCTTHTMMPLMYEPTAVDSSCSAMEQLRITSGAWGGGGGRRARRAASQGAAGVAVQCLICNTRWHGLTLLTLPCTARQCHVGGLRSISAGPRKVSFPRQCAQRPWPHDPRHRPRCPSKPGRPRGQTADGFRLCSNPPPPSSLPSHCISPLPRPRPTWS